MSVKGGEIRSRFPRIVMNLVMAFIFWIISAFIPPTIDIDVPSLNTNASFLIQVVTTVVLAIFLIRALSDALVLGDILTDVVVRRLGIKEERSPKRAARDFIYIIIIILIATAISPVFKRVRVLKDIGPVLNTATTYVALGLIILLIYDIGRILYRITEQKADSLADRLARMTEKDKNQ